MRERALRYGWAEPLSLVRQGFQLFGGAGVVPPGGGSSCLMLHGDVHDTALVLLAFVSLGWSVLGDRFVPTRWQEGQLVAYPTDSPVLLSKRRAEKRGISGTKVRSHTDALEIDVPRSDSPADVAGVALLRIARPEDEVLTVLTGHERFEPAVNYQVAGVLGRFTAEGLPAAPPKEVMAEHLRLAAIPAVRLSFSEDALEANLAALVAWWDAL